MSDVRLPAVKATDRVQVREIRIAPSPPAGLHVHNGPVFGRIVAGSVVYQIDGQPASVLGQGYPWSWSVVTWLPGEIAAASPDLDMETAALRLAGFVVALQAVDPEPAGGAVRRARSAAQCYRWCGGGGGMVSTLGAGSGQTNRTGQGA